MKLMNDLPRTKTGRRRRALEIIEDEARKSKMVWIRQYVEMPCCPVCGAVRKNHLFRTVCTVCGVKEGEP